MRILSANPPNQPFVSALCAMCMLFASCTRHGEESELPYYTLDLQFDAQASLSSAAILLRRWIEEECAMEGHARTFYEQAYGEGNAIHVYQSHGYDGNLRTGGLLVESAGKVFTLRLDLFLSGFDGEEDLNSCRVAIQERMAKGAAGFRDREVEE